MTGTFITQEYKIQYTESVIDPSVLWENHCHSQFEMIAVLDGDVSIMLEGRNYRLTKDQTVIIPPLLYHTITANQKGIYRRLTALFDLSAIPDVLQAHFAKRETDIAIFFSPRIKELKRICREKETEFYAPLVRSLMTQIFYDDLQSIEARDVANTDEFLKNVILYIDQHLYEKILLDDLAKHTSRSKSSFCHLFEEKMGISPKQYILQKKLALANKLIGDGTPPTVVAIQVGYENYSNFYRMYRKRFGVNPAKKI